MTGGSWCMNTPASPPPGRLSWGVTRAGSHRVPMAVSTSCPLGSLAFLCPHYLQEIASQINHLHLILISGSVLREPKLRQFFFPDLRDETVEGRKALKEESSQSLVIHQMCT